VQVSKVISEARIARSSYRTKMYEPAKIQTKGFGI
jgi:hypothetical protein